MTTELQAAPRNITGLVKSVDTDNKAWIEQTRPKLDHPVGYFTRGAELAVRLEELVGQLVSLTIGADRVKTDRNDDGDFKSYWWSIRSVDNAEGPPVQAPPKPDPAPRPEPSTRTGSPDIEPPPPHPGALGQCQNHANDAIINDIWPVPEGRDYTSWLRECRDWIYYNVNQPLPEPRHYCYQHNQERRQSKTGNWGHLLPKEADEDEDSYCIEGREGWRVFDASQR